MKRILSILVCSLAATALCIASLAFAQEKSTPTRQKASDEETRQVADIIRVPSATQKVQLLAAFLAAYPASAARPRLLSNVGTMISREQNATVRVTLAERFLDLMSTEQERCNAAAVLAEAYLSVNRVDDAFRTLALFSNSDSLDLRLLIRVVIAGTDEVRQRNLRHLSDSRKYGGLAIRAIDAGLRPGDEDVTTWAAHKRKTLSMLYPSLGLLALHAGQPSDAVTLLHKAIDLAPDDPSNYSFLGAAAVAEYSTASQQLKQMTAGSVRDALEQRTTEFLNQAVDAYAHAVALSAGSAQEQAIRAQVGPDLETYYKLLHQGSLEGLQAHIEKYRRH